MQYSSAPSRPLTLQASTESATYALFALAVGLTVVGVLAGMSFAATLLSTGLLSIFLVLELGLIFTSRWWSATTPLNYVLFALFPLLSGITVTPYLMQLLHEYVNGASILFNALGATVCMSLAASVVARMTSIRLAGWGRALVLALLGLVAMQLLQLFIPSMRSAGLELLLSGAGIVLFSVFLAYDLQRVAQMSRLGAQPVLLALSLYLDVFNLFLSLLRFMQVLSGDRR